mgnify:CR=1 FL=1
MKPVDELVAAMVACLTEDLHELFQERAAIRQYDGGQSRELAEAMAVLDVIRLIPNAAPELIESSCCGMAGSFGYESSHHTVSMQMAELSLLPAVRAKPDAIVVADGTSCRHQIEDGTSRQAIHVAQLLSDHLKH